MKISPGTYQFDHIDFDKSKHAAGKTQFFNDFKKTKLTFKAGRIYFVGNLKLSKKGPGRYGIEVVRDPALLIEACREFPDIFRKFPVTSLYGSKLMAFNCDE